MPPERGVRVLPVEAEKSGLALLTPLPVGPAPFPREGVGKVLGVLTPLKLPPVPGETLPLVLALPPPPPPPDAEGDWVSLPVPLREAEIDGDWVLPNWLAELTGEDVTASTPVLLGLIVPPSP